MKRLSISFLIISVLAAAGGLAQQLSAPGAKPTATAPKAAPQPALAAPSEIPASPARGPEPALGAPASPPAAALPAPEPPTLRAETKTTRGWADTSYPNLPSGELQATPEMWFYQQAMRQYQDPNMAVRRVAEFRAAERARRTESRRWFGLSNQRPLASPDPVNGDYSPGWVSNYQYYPFRWAGVGGF
ncbi:MAG: hypothetical protein ABSF26_23860 [Thermoguttaceae bacterium]